MTADQKPTQMGPVHDEYCAAKSFHRRDPGADRLDGIDFGSISRIRYQHIHICPFGGGSVFQLFRQHTLDTRLAALIPDQSANYC